MPGTSEGVKKAWLKRKRKGGKAKVAPHPETQDTLKKGLTLNDLSKKWGVTVKQIIKLNKFTSLDQIKAGINVKIPALLSKEQKAEASVQKQLEANKKAAEKASKPKKKKSS